MREEPVFVKLKTEWMGNAPGSVVKLPPRMADSLFRRNAGEIFEADQPNRIKAKLQRRDRDKMVHKAPVNKSLN